MPDKSEKEKRKEILDNLRKKADEKFENSLPMDRKYFKNLFDFLDKELEGKGCDHTSLLTQTFLTHHKIENADKILEWLSEKGGYCDCEILANVEEQFE